MILNIKNREVIIDDEDFKKVSKYKWRINDSGYVMRQSGNARIKELRKTIRLHRFIMNLKNNSIFIDHINGNKLDNRKSNLRLCTKFQNNVNVPIGRNNTSGFKGVSFNKLRKKYYAGICYKKIQYHLGVFVNKIDAARVYNEKAKELFGDFAYLNKI